MSNQFKLFLKYFFLFFLFTILLVFPIYTHANPQIPTPYVLITEPIWYSGYPTTAVRIRYVVTDTNNEVSHGHIQFDDGPIIENTNPMGWYETTSLSPGFHTVTVKLVSADHTGFSNKESISVSSFFVGSIPSPYPTLVPQYKEWASDNTKLYFQRLLYLEGDTYVDIPSSASITSETSTDGIKTVELSWPKGDRTMKFGMKLVKNTNEWYTEKLWLDYGFGQNRHEFTGRYFYAPWGEPYIFGGMYNFGEMSQYLNIENIRIEAFTTNQNPVSPTPVCSMHNQGDANCDGQINLSDYEIWRREYLGEITMLTADFSKDLQVKLEDFEIWRRAFTR